MVRKDRLKIDILTIFPGMFAGCFDESLLGKARKKGILDIRLTDIRSFTADKHRTVDDRPFGGGAGMVMKPEPILRALKNCSKGSKPKVILLSPRGKLFTGDTAKRFAEKKHLVLICGHYEGIDERVMRFADEEISIGDYVLTGGEIPAMIVVDAVARFIPGVVKECASVENDSFFNGRLDYPHYTRPAVFKGMRVPATLRSGDHAAINKWRKCKSLRDTLERRPDLFQLKEATMDEERLMEETEHTIKKHKGARR